MIDKFPFQQNLTEQRYNYFLCELFKKKASCLTFFFIIKKERKW